MKPSTKNSQLSTEVRERAMLMCAEMVRATLDDRKTQTRRVITDADTTELLDRFAGEYSVDDEDGDLLTTFVQNFERKNDDGSSYRYTGLLVQSAEYPEEGAEEIFCQYGHPGDRLWVKETFYIDHFDYLGPIAGLPPLDGDQKRAMLYYAADGDVCDQIPECDCTDGPPKLRPSIFMPRWASRLTLEIVGIRVQRVQEITLKDCIAEGVYVDSGDGQSDDEQALIARDCFECLWNQLNGIGARGKFAWNKNPWVWVIEFKRLTP